MTLDSRMGLLFAVADLASDWGQAVLSSQSLATLATLGCAADISMAMIIRDLDANAFSAPQL